MASSSAVAMDRPPPTILAIVVATAILAGVTGYFIGQGASIFPSPGPRRRSEKSRAEESESDEDELESDEEDEDGGLLASFDGNTDEVKLVLVVRTDLGMGKGEFARY
jgi:PTH2 family peptidyl-tRNA hydrolase